MWMGKQNSIEISVLNTEWVQRDTVIYVGDIKSGTAANKWVGPIWYKYGVSQVALIKGPILFTLAFCLILGLLFFHFFLNM